MKILRSYDPDIAKRILSVAIPIIFANASRSMMGIVDMIMVGRLGVHSIAAVGFGELIIYSFIAIIGFSIQVSTKTISARRFGEKNYLKCFESLINGQILGFCLGLPILLFGYIYCEKIIQLLLDDPITISECIKYTSIQFVGILFPIMCFIFKGYYTGIQQTFIYLKVVISANIINIYLNFGLIFGSSKLDDFFENSLISEFINLSLLWKIFPFPEMGIAGAALGTVLATAFSLLCFFLYMFSNTIKKNIIYSEISFKYHLLVKHLKLTWPIMQQQGSIHFGFTFFLAIVGMIGIHEMAATNIMFRIFGLAVMPAIGIGDACGSLVGYYLGENNPDKSVKCIKESYKYSFFIMGIFALCWILFTDPIISIFNPDEKLKGIAIPLLRFTSLFALMESINVVWISALEGAGDVKFVSRLFHVYIWILLLPLSYLTGIYIGIGLWGTWNSLLIADIILTFVVSKRIKQGKWKHIAL